MYLTTYISYEINDDFVAKHYVGHPNYTGYPDKESSYIEAFNDGEVEQEIIGKEFILSKNIEEYKVVDVNLIKYKILERIGWVGENASLAWDYIMKLPSISTTFNMFNPSFYIGDINVLEDVSIKDLQHFLVNQLDIIEN